MQQKNLIAPLIVAAVVVGGGSFYGGMQYQKSQRPAQQSQRGGGNGQRGPGGLGGVRGGMGGGFISGEVLAKDTQSITIKLRDGSSKIVFFASSTAVGKMDAGTITDVLKGSQVTIIGATNSDGSITANNIQIRPEGMMQPPRSSDDRQATSTK